jgi:hypothetical protein
MVTGWQPASAGFAASASGFEPLAMDEYQPSISDKPFNVWRRNTKFDALALHPTP